MNSASQDIADTVRQLQKLSRELQPVKAALAAIAKRERATPNAATAAGSLDKVASRVQEVSRKYSSFFSRVNFLLDAEFPRLQAITPLLEVCRDGEDTSGEGNSGQDPFRLVCSPIVPHILNRTSYHVVCGVIRLHMEMVDYLIATERYQLACHVADAYGLPLYLFPRLAALVLPPLPPIQNNSAGSEERGGGRDSTSLPASALVSPYLGPVSAKATLGSNETGPPHDSVPPEHIAVKCIEAKHSVMEAIAYCEGKLLPALESIEPERRPKEMEVLYDLLLDLHVTRILQLFQGGTTGQEAIHVYLANNILRWATRRPYFVQTVINALTLRSEAGATAVSPQKSAVQNGRERTPNGRSACRTSQKDEEAIRLVACMMSVEGYRKLAVLFHRGAILAGSQILSLAETLERRRASAASQSQAVGSDACASTMEGCKCELPDLVVRAVAASILLKDEYFDRMVISRRSAADAENGGGETQAIQIPPTHLNTQSGSAAFDGAVMAIVEEMLRSFFCNKQNSEAQQSGRGKSLDGVNSCVPLNASDLLQVEERWSNDVIFIRRPTRFYCYITKECFDGGRGGNYPLALPNGTVVSKLAIMQYHSKNVSQSDHAQPVVVCPRTGEEFPISAIKRIFVT